MAKHLPSYFKTAILARKCGQAAKKTMPRPKDWRVDVWWNPEHVWHVCLVSGPISIYYSGDYWHVMVSDDVKRAHCGAAQFYGLSRNGCTPREALQRTAKPVINRIKQETAKLAAVKTHIESVLL